MCLETWDGARGEGEQATMRRSFGRKLALGFGVLAFLAAFGSLVLFVIILGRRGIADPITASLFASGLFFLSSGLVLYFISRPPRPLPEAGEGEPEPAGEGEAP